MTFDNQMRSSYIQSQWRNRLAQFLSHVSADFPSSDFNMDKRLQVFQVFKGSPLESLAELKGLNVNSLSLIEHLKTLPNFSAML